MARQPLIFLGELLLGSGHHFYDHHNRIVVYWCGIEAKWVAKCCLPGFSVLSCMGDSPHTALAKVEQSLVEQFRSMGTLLGYEVE